MNAPTPKELMQQVVQRSEVFPPQDSDSGGDEDARDYHRNAPKPSEACLYGLVGEVARAGSANTEANPYAVAINFMAYMSCAVGRGPYFYLGDTRHHARLFTLHVGRSGVGRKGDAISLIKKIDSRLRNSYELVAPKIHSGGLSSREGLIYLVHDGYKDGAKDVEPVTDKRLWVVESEFANVLHQSSRDGNTLSAAVRDLWDGASLQPATKTNRMFTTDPHICISGAITPKELIDLMASREMSNGFANRFMIFFAERLKTISFPEPTPNEVVDELSRKARDIIDFCKFGAGSNARISLNPEARHMYDKLYQGELSENKYGERIAGVTERRAPMLLRISMLFALLDKKLKIEPTHINAAIAWIRYLVDSVRFIFASGKDEVENTEVNDTAEDIVNFLRRRGEASKTEITRECFNGNKNGDQIDKAIADLLTTSPPRIEVQEVRNEARKAGRAKKIYRLPDGSALKASA